MPNFTALAIAALAVVPLTAPAAAAPSKAKAIKLPASSLTDPAARLCMPKSVLPSPTRDQPNTICQTQADWAAAGVTIQAR